MEVELESITAVTVCTRSVVLKIQQLLIYQSLI